jgi:RpiR family murPQ operon transcriptional repressor
MPHFKKNFKKTLAKGNSFALLRTNATVLIEQGAGMKATLEYRKKISKAYSRLGKKKRVLADFLLNHPERVLELTITKLATECHCDATTVVRFAQQLGYSGFPELKMSVARQAGAPWSEFPAAGSADDFGAKLQYLHVEAIKATFQNLKPAVLEQAVGKLFSSRKIMLCGAGASRFPAGDLHIKLMRLGFQALCLPDFEFWKTFAGYMDRTDALVVFSNSGETPQAVEIASIAKEKSVCVIAVTAFEGSRLGSLADICILTEGKGESFFRLGVMASRISQLFIVDLLTVYLSLKNKERSWSFLKRSYEQHIKK